MMYTFNVDDENGCPLKLSYEGTEDQTINGLRDVLETLSKDPSCTTYVVYITKKE